MSTSQPFLLIPVAVDSDDEEIDPFVMILPEDIQVPNPSPPSLPAVDLNSDDLILRHHIPSINSTLSIRQLPSLGISFQLWPAASTLVSYLPELSLSDTGGGNLGWTGADASPPLVSATSPRRIRVLELGSGTGLVGIAAASILGADVTVSDLAPALPNLLFNSALNADVVAAGGGSVAVAEIGWGVREQMEVVGRDFDLVLGSDLVYHDNLYEPLLQTIKYFLGGDRDLVFLMAHLKRWKKESAFFNRARKMFAVEIVHREIPADGKRLGVLVYRFMAKRHRLT